MPIRFPLHSSPNNTVRHLFPYEIYIGAQSIPICLWLLEHSSWILLCVFRDMDIEIVFSFYYGHILLWNESSNFSINLNTYHTWSPAYCCSKLLFQVRTRYILKSEYFKIQESWIKACLLISIHIFFLRNSVVLYYK